MHKECVMMLSPLTISRQSAVNQKRYRKCYATLLKMLRYVTKNKNKDNTKQTYKNKNTVCLKKRKKKVCVCVCGGGGGGQVGDG